MLLVVDSTVRKTSWGAVVGGPQLLQQVLLVSRKEVLTAGVEGWHPSLASGQTTLRMASQLRAAVGESFVVSQLAGY